MKYNIIKLLICLTTLLISINAHAQDFIVLKNGDEIKSKVLEITQSEIKYKKYDNIDGPTISIAKTNVSMLRYANGTMDIINPNKSNVTNSNEINKDLGENTNLSNSPTSKNHTFVNLNIASIYALDLPKSNKTFNLSANIDFGYFILKNFAITSNIGFGSTKTTIPSSTTTRSERYIMYYSYGVPIYGNRNVTDKVPETNSSMNYYTYGAGFRYYIAGKLFLGASLISAKVSNFDATSCAYFQIGFAGFITKRVAIEPAFSYIKGLGTIDTKSIQGKIGFGFYF